VARRTSKEIEIADDTHGVRHAKRLLPLAVFLLASACSATGLADAPITVLAGAYSAVSINGNSLPVETAPRPDGFKQEILSERLWLGGTAGTNGSLRRTVFRMTDTSGVHIDSATSTGTFYPTLATATTSFGAVSASGSQLILKGTDGSTRVYARAE
jgi:hypothetical protein